MVAFTYLGLLAFMLFIEIIRKKTGKLDFLSLAHFMFSLSYVIPGFLLEANFGNSSSDMTLNSLNYKSNIQTIFAVFIGYFLVLIGFYAKSAIGLGKNVIIRSTNNKYVLWYSFLLLILSCLAIFIYGAQYGGVLNAMANITLIRSNAGVDSGPLVFVKHFMYCSLFASYFLGSFAFGNTQNKALKIFLLAIFFCSVIVAFIASTLSGGRAILIYYFFGFYLVYVLKGGKTLTWGTIPIFCFGALFLLYGKEFFWSISAINDGFDAVVNKFIEAKNSHSSGEKFSIYRLMANFAFPIQSLDTAFDKNYNVRFFVDWIYGFLYFIPERIFDIRKPETISTINTRYILGLKGTLTYEIPTGFLAFAVYSLSWPGIIIVSYCYGWIGRYLQTILIINMQHNPWIVYLYALTMQVWVDYQQSGDPRVFLVANFWYIMSTLVLLILVAQELLTPKRKSHVY
jgi:protein-S-isoprenylcysteine O-methyltransferase Ste14